QRPSGSGASTHTIDPVRNSWWPGSPLATPCDNHTLTALPSGQVLVAGGETSYVALASAQLFQAQAGIVVPAPLTATAGGAFNFTVTAEDANGNTLTGYTGTVHFTSS